MRRILSLWLPSLATDARVLFPDLKTVSAAPQADLACLARLAGRYSRWMPWPAAGGLDADGGAGIWLDVSGCAHLFGGEQGLPRGGWFMHGVFA